jgi:hypothetical protein
MATFGRTTSGNESVQFDYGIGNRIVGGVFTCPTAGTANSITWHSPIFDTAGSVRCAIYNNALNTLIGTTDEVLVEGSGWITNNFSTTVNLTASTDYYIVAWGDTAPINKFLYIGYQDPGVGSYYIRDTTPYTGSFPADISDGSLYNNYEYAMYCTYTESGGAAPAVNMYVPLIFIK